MAGPSGPPTCLWQRARGRAIGFGGGFGVGIGMAPAARVGHGPALRAGFDVARADGHLVTLVYGAHDEEHNNAVALKEYLERG